MTRRASRYAVVSPTVFRHPTGHAVRAVLHTATGRLFLADLGTAARLADGSEPDAMRDEQLAAAGLLVDAGRDEAAEVIAAGRVAAAGGRTYGLVVMPSAYCNMSCGYCGQEHERTALTGPHRAALAARVDRIVRSGRYDRINVRWFGGEPLMGYAVLRDLSAGFVAGADAVGVTYSAKLVTNGVLLDARKLRELHGACRVDLIEVTLDGPERAHDVTRPVKRGGGSFRRIVGTLAAALADPALTGLRFLVRTNVSVHNAALAEEFAAGLAAAGLAHDRVQCYPAPVHSWSNDVTTVAVAGRRMADVEMDWFRAYQRHGLRFALLPPAPVRVTCSAVTRHSEVVAADGRVFSCTEQPLVPSLRKTAVGHVTELRTGTPRPAGAFDDWYDALAAGETPCRSCAILPICGGACPKLWRDGLPPCPPMRDNLHERLDLYALRVGCTPATGGV